MEEEILKTRTEVKTLVKAMGGKITLESREGSGTRFMVRIPPLYSGKGDIIYEGIDSKR